MYKGYHLSADLSDFNFIKQHDCDIFYKDMNNKIINSIKNFYFQSKDFHCQINMFLYLTLIMILI